MRRLPFLLLVVLLSFSIACNRTKKSPEAGISINPIWKKIPCSWIEKARKFAYKKSDTTLLTEFAGLITPDTLYGTHTPHVDLDDGFIFNIISADIDGDNTAEFICLQGWDVYYPALCVFKQVNGNWYLIYKEDIDTFYSSPTIAIANNYSKNKTFYLRRVYNHGSGIYADGYSFYKLADNKVFKCLDIVNESHIYGWGLFLNQEVNTKFEFTGDATDELRVRYYYNFFPGAINSSDCSWCANTDISLIKGEDNVSYVYDSAKRQYKLDLPAHSEATDLTAEKIATFSDFGNDSLFVKAFKQHIDVILKEGTPVQKQILKRYLKIAAKNKTVTTDELEIKSEADGTKFYGPKK